MHKHDYQPWANPSEELFKELGFKTVLMCTKCHKIKKIKNYIEAPLDYDVLLKYLGKELKLNNKNIKNINTEALYNEVVIDTDKYKKLFLGGTH